jgi:DNA modification methylase
MKLRLNKKEIPPHLLKYFKPVGFKPKDEIDIGNMVCEALREDGWYRRATIIWHKPNPMPESVTDRPTKAHEYLFLLTKSPRYYYDAEAIKEPSKYPDDNRKARSRVEHKRMPTLQVAGVRPGSAVYPAHNRRSVWTVSTKPFAEAHFATFPEKLIKPCILAGSRPDDLVLDPFSGAGTTGVVSIKHGRNYLGLELNPEYAEMSRRRIAASERPMMALFGTQEPSALSGDNDRTPPQVLSA